MIYQIDDRLAEFSKNLWEPLPISPDAQVQLPKITESGRLIQTSEPLAGPETDNERFFTLIWNSAKPSRWFKPDDLGRNVIITDEGRLLGDVGFSFRFVRTPSLADQKTTFVPAWEFV